MASGFIAIYKDEKLPLILALGITDNVLCWTRLAKSLELEYDITMTDARGHSGSDAPDKRCGKQYHVTDLVGLIENQA